jgi:DNA-binding NarL/FixJ family response regulator
MSGDVKLKNRTMKILIVDDHALVRQGLAQALQNLSPDLQLLEARDGAQALAMLTPHPDMDLVLLDYHLPDSKGLEVLVEIERVQPTLPVLMMSGLCTPQVMRQALQLGALGFLSKAAASEEFLLGVQNALKGEVVIPQALLDSRGGPKFQDFFLSPRQERVLAHLVNGLTNREIAAALHVSEETIKTHMSSILRYFDVQNRTQAVVAAANYDFKTRVNKART